MTSRGFLPFGLDDESPVSSMIPGLPAASSAVVNAAVAQAVTPDVESDALPELPDDVSPASIYTWRRLRRTRAPA
jgi:hypothetical protein